VCSSSYVRSRGPPGEAPALPQFLPQYFKFLAHNPLSVRTKVPTAAGRAARGPLGRGRRVSGRGLREAGACRLWGRTSIVATPCVSYCAPAHAGAGPLTRSLAERRACVSTRSRRPGPSARPRETRAAAGERLQEACVECRIARSQLRAAAAA